MIIKKDHLKQIIKEEIEYVLKEENLDEVLGAVGAYAKDWAKKQWNKFAIDPSGKKQPQQQQTGPTSMGAQAAQQVDQNAKTAANTLQNAKIPLSKIAEIDTLVNKINTTKNAKEIQKIVDASINTLVMSGLQKLNSAYNIGDKEEQAKKLFDVSKQFEKSLKDFNALNIAAARIPISRQSAAKMASQKANAQASAAAKATKTATANQQGLAAQLSLIPGAETSKMDTAAKQIYKSPAPAASPAPPAARSNPTRSRPATGPINRTANK